MDPTPPCSKTRVKTESKVEEWSGTWWGADVRVSGCQMVRKGVSMVCRRISPKELKILQEQLYKVRVFFRS